MEKIEQILARIILALLHFVCEAAKMVVFTYQVAMGHYNERLKKGAYPLFSGIATLLTGIIFIRIASGSIISVGYLYFIACAAMRFGIMWASEGDWSHILSGGQYNFGKGLKADLIENDRFAAFISGLNGNVFAKALQIIILLACVACVLYLVYVFFTCLWHTIVSTKDYIEYRSKRGRRNHNGSGNGRRIHRSSNPSYKNDDNRRNRSDRNIVHFPRRKIG